MRRTLGLASKAPGVRGQPRQTVQAPALSFSAQPIASRGSRQQQCPVKRINDAGEESSARCAGEFIALEPVAIEMRRTGPAKHESRPAFRTLGLAKARRLFVCFGHHANRSFEARIPTPPLCLELAEKRLAASRAYQKKAYQRYPCAGQVPNRPEKSGSSAPLTLIEQ